QDCSLESFLRDAFKLAGWEAPLTDCCMLTIDDGRIVDTMVWGSLLATGEVEKHIFTPNERQRDPGMHDTSECIKYSRHQVTSSAYTSAAYQSNSAHLSRPYKSLSDRPESATIDSVAVYFPDGLTAHGTSSDANASRQNSDASRKFWVGLRSCPHHREYIKDLDDLRSVLRLENEARSTEKREVTLSIPSNDDLRFGQATLVPNHEQWKAELVCHRHESLLEQDFVEEETLIPDAYGRYNLSRSCEFTLIRELFALSEEVFSFFLPREWDQQQTKQVYKHLWGTLDEIIRTFARPPFYMLAESSPFESPR
ncbi:hypothetical protein NW768_008453, partial [Fusarium equiseti]